MNVDSLLRPVTMQIAAGMSLPKARVVVVAAVETLIQPILD
jgi:hypothetical protein